MCNLRNDSCQEHGPAVLGRIGGVAETQEVIDYSAARNTKADIELIRAEDINRAYERVVNKDVRYRFVIDMASLNAAGGKG